MYDQLVTMLVGRARRSDSKLTGEGGLLQLLANRWANFALFDIVGKQLSPWVWDLGKITLHRTGPRAGVLNRYPRAGALLARRLNLDLIADMWDDLLRVAESVQGGDATAAMVGGKLCSS